MGYIQDQINLEIQKNIDDIFNNYIKYVKSFMSFQLEDIETQSSITEDKNLLRLLENRKKLLKSDKYIKRFRGIYLDSPISDTANFYAAKIFWTN